MVDAPKKSRSASDRRTTLRQGLWPDVVEGQLWLRKQRAGFTTVPRTLPLIGQILDQESGKGFPLSGVYFTLWCWVYDEGIVEVRDPRAMAHESGFSGPRAESTWRTRMKRLADLGLIKARPGLAGEFQFVLLLNPLQRIKALYADREPDILYTALLGRMAQVGADDMDV
jgi:hypothetical protein